MWPLRAENKEHLGGVEVEDTALQQPSYFTEGETEAWRGEGPHPSHSES